MTNSVKWIPLAIAAVGLSLASVSAAAQGQGGGQAQASGTQANSLQQLLTDVQADLNRQTAQDKARVRRFLAARDHQQQLVNQAKQELANENARTSSLKAQFDANEKLLTNLTTTLNEREGNLGEVFGIVRQSAGQFKSSLDSSIISAEYPNRSLFPAKIAASTALPSIHDLKRLWYEMLQELVAQSQVVKYPANVTLVNGSKVHKDVVRVGTFNTVMGGQYLQYEPTSQSLLVIARQPSRYTSSAADLYRASGGGFTGFGIDPLRGQLLALNIRVPTFRQRLNEGGVPGYTILVLFAIALLVCLERGIYLTISSRRIKRQLKSETPNTNNALGRILSVYDQNRKEDVETLTLKLDEAIMKEVPALEARQNFIKLIAAVGPLLGLLGTVIGMVQTFTAITLFGTGNPAYMAAGIEYALVTTVEGLVAAIPLVFLHSFISGKSRQLIQILEEQSAGIIAAQAEKANQ